MLHALMMYLRLRRLNGRTLLVSRGGAGLLAARRVSVTLLGIHGVDADGDDTFFAWPSVKYVQWGARIERIAARSAEETERGGDEDYGGTPVDRMLRAMRATRSSTEDARDDDTPKPALSDEEIAAALAEDKKGLV